MITSFPCHQWLPDPSRPLSEAHITLFPNKQPRSTEDNKVMYKVLVQTSCDRWAGTDANVSLEVLGAANGTGFLPLENSANNFERGKLDTFFVSGLDVGTITAVQV
jgi:hypothetical protein